MNIVAIIPARFGSTRLHGKPLASIGGKPMIQWVYERAKGSLLLSDIIVATDDERILKAVKSFGGKAVMTGKELRSGTDRVAEAISGIPAEIVVNIQGDEPLIDSRMIDDAIRPLLDCPDILLGTLKTRITDEEQYHDPNVVKVVTDKEGFALYFSRSPIPYGSAPFKVNALLPYKHVGLYVFRRDFLMQFSRLEPSALEKMENLEQLRAIENGFRIKVVETACNPISVDTPEDLEKVRSMIHSGDSVWQARV